MAKDSRLSTRQRELEQIRTSLNFGLFRLSDTGKYVAAGCQSVGDFIDCPFVMDCDGEMAKVGFGSWCSTLFSYAPPRIYFRPAEQRLLLAALRGVTDAELGDELGVSLSAAKKAWRAIYDRAAALASP